MYKRQRNVPYTGTGPVREGGNTDCQRKTICAVSYTHLKSGQIGCVVVKDFSRFGRDYLEVGFYIEYIFPLLQIRFISINDSYDSEASSGMTGGMNVALKNLVYNMYSLDLSKKISSAMQTRMKNGTRLPVNARYGYRKDVYKRQLVDCEKSVTGKPMNCRSLCAGAFGL